MNSLTTPCFQKIRMENIFSTFHHQEIPRIGIVFVGSLRDLLWEVKIVHLFFQEGTSTKFLILLLSYFPVFWMQMSSAFAIIFADCHGLSCVHVRASSYTGLFSSFPGWCRAYVCRSGSKDICMLQHGFLCFLLFLYSYFHSLACIITHLWFFITSARSLRFGSRPWKVNIDHNWNPLLSLFVSENPPHLWLYFSRKCVFICYLFPLEHETRFW